MKFDFELDDFQKQSIEEINNKNDILVTSHTGSGKTSIAEYAIYKYLNENKKIYYVSPIKTLANEKYSQFKNKFFEFEIGLNTGDNKINIDANCVVIIAEILHNTIDNLDLDCIVLDEIHYINNVERGHIWENILIKSIKSHLIMLSATVQNKEYFSKWLYSIRNKEIKIISTIKRPIPLKYYIYNNELCDLKSAKFNSQFSISYNKLFETLNNKKMLPVILFIFNKKKCEIISNKINKNFVTCDERKEIFNIFNKYITSEYHKTVQYNQIIKLLEKGIAFHHAGMITKIKEVIEILFSKKLIKVLIATETLAVGINMPTKTVIFNELKFLNNYITKTQFQQISGRAGRRGYDEYGNVIILNNYYDKSIIMSYLNEISEELISKYKFNYYTILNNISNLEDYFKKSFHNFDNSIEIENLKKKVRNDDDIFLNSKKKKFKKINLDIIFNNKDIDEKIININNSFLVKTDYYINILKTLNYITKDNRLTTKGIIASKLTEIDDSVFLIEIISNNIFDNLSIEDIIISLSYFIYENKFNNNTNKFNKYMKKNIIEIDEKLKKIYHNIYNKEYNQSYIYKFLIDKWLNMKNLSELKEYFIEFDEMEGIFIKNIIKLNNIIKNIYEICDDNNLKQKLENSEELLLKDIVNTNSIYLQNY